MATKIEQAVEYLRNAIVQADSAEAKAARRNSSVGHAVEHDNFN